jgi:hypothetical protein
MKFSLNTAAFRTSGTLSLSVANPSKPHVIIFTIYFTSMDDLSRRSL